MSKKNTIIIAVLVNAGLLLILFVTALRGKGENKKNENTPVMAVSTEKKEEVTPQVTTEDLLNEYIAKVPSQSTEEEVVILEEADLLDVASLNSTSSLPAVTTPSLAPSPTTSVSPSSVSIPVASQAVAPPSTAPLAISKQTEEISEVVVKKGDYLEKIAKANNSSVNAIMKANNLASTNLKIGQVLKIPRKGIDVKKEAAPQAQPSSSGDNIYVVKAGDNPTIIASKCHVKLDELLRLNNIDAEKAKKLRPGDKLRIR